MNKIHRRFLLRAGALGGLTGVVSACSAAPPTATVPTAVPVVPPATPPPVIDATREAAKVEPKASPPAPATTVATSPAAPSTAPAPLGATLAGMTSAAKAWHASLSDTQRKVATFSLKDAEHVRWHWTNTGAFPRNGLSLNDMQPAQREGALALLRSGLSEAGFRKAGEIMQLQPEIGGDPLNYFVSMFGNPGDAVWGWRFEGHHLSRRFTVAGDRVTVTPFFHGVWPTGSAAGKPIMQREEFAARELMRSLDRALATRVLYQSSPPGQHVTWNDTYVKPLPQAGVALAELKSDGQALAREVLETWLGTLAPAIAKMYVDRVLAPGLDKISFGWAGSLEERRPHYYRMQGPNFLLEHDNTRNGAQHIHSVWRMFDEDFGQGLI